MAQAARARDRRNPKDDAGTPRRAVTRVTTAWAAAGTAIRTLHDAPRPGPLEAAGEAVDLARTDPQPRAGQHQVFGVVQPRGQGSGPHGDQVVELDTHRSAKILPVVGGALGKSGEVPHLDARRPSESGAERDVGDAILSNSVHGLSRVYGGSAAGPA